MSMTFAVAMKNYFGYKDEYKGSSGLTGFYKEMKELTPKDKEELRPLLAKELGVEVTG